MASTWWSITCGARTGSGCRRPIAWALTLGAVMVGWVFFRAPSLQRAQVILSGMAGLSGFVWPDLAYSIGGNRFKLLLPALALVLWCPNRQAISGVALEERLRLCRRRSRCLLG